MLYLKKEIFDGKYCIFQNDENKKYGIASREGSIVFNDQFEAILKESDSLVLVTKRFRSPAQSGLDTLSFGIIDDNMNLVVDPDSKKYCNFNGYLAIQNKAESLVNQKNNHFVKVK